MNGKRPVGVALLAIHTYIEAAWALVITILIIAFPKALHFLYGYPHAFDRYPLRSRLLWGMLCLLIAFLVYVWAKGLWKLKNWARLLIIAVTLLSLYPAGGFSGVTLLQLLIPAGPIREIVGLSFLIVVVVYLFSPRVRQAFGVNSTSRRWQLAAGILCLISIGVVIYKSKPEIRAFRWHRQHGDTVTINGVSFPIYKWDTPEQNCHCQTLEITAFQRRGPLLPNEATYFITVEGSKEQSSLTAEQRADAEVLEIKGAGYTSVSKSQLVIAKQTLSCARNERELSQSLECYGEGPIYHVFFAGDDAALERFNWMMASAK